MHDLGNPGTQALLDRRTTQTPGLLQNRTRDHLDEAKIQRDRRDLGDLRRRQGDWKLNIKARKQSSLVLLDRTSRGQGRSRNGEDPQIGAQIYLPARDR